MWTSRVVSKSRVDRKPKHTHRRRTHSHKYTQTTTHSRIAVDHEQRFDDSHIYIHIESNTCAPVFTDKHSYTHGHTNTLTRAQNEYCSHDIKRQNKKNTYSRRIADKLFSCVIFHNKIFHSAFFFHLFYHLQAISHCAPFD